MRDRRGSVRRGAARAALVGALAAALAAGTIAGPAGGGAAWAQSPAPPAEPPVAAEARAFMEAYGAALLAGDRAGLAGRYHRAGTHVVGNGRSTLEPHTATRAFYAGEGWQPPEAFAWQDLRYEPLGPDAVVVTGTFRWDPKGEKPAVTVAYTALLVREDGVLRIRLEHE
ncbi:MAG TPA: nuclear transport factor 2 family protein [Caulobacter sp.]|nr:nuclear transport factor 2 family protein [Caulobacter sp.]